MKLLKNPNKLLFITLFLLCIVNILQGYFTELLDDEAYYWVYSQFLDWGYFDHPPMVAIWITISSFFFENGELGVRILSAITLSLNIFFIWKLIDFPKKSNYTWLFLLIVLSTTLFNAYGFITVPDTPLLFFMSIFLLGYKKYLKDKSNLSYLIISLAVAGLLYSKYQGVLIVFFVLLSNIKVLKDYKIWITGFVALLLFFPHLYWQYANDYPTFRYHLFERTAKSSYKIENSLLHFVNMFAIIGVTFIFFYKAFFKNLKTKNQFQKGLNYIVGGFLVFFFLMSFKGHVQAQWIVPISIPLMIIVFHYLVNNQHKITLFKRLAFINIALIILIRIVMAFESILPFQLDMHGHKQWVSELQKKTKGKKKVFFNSYQRASTYLFYSKDPIASYNYFNDRKNHFDLLNINNTVFNEDVYYITNKDYGYSNFGIKRKNKDSLYVSYINGFKAPNLLKININNVKTSNDNTISIDMINTSKNNFSINDFDFYLVLFDKNKHLLFLNGKKAKKYKISDFDLFTIPLSINDKILKIEEKNLVNTTIKIPKRTISLVNKAEYIQIIGKNNPKLHLTRLSKMYSLQKD
ncbi:dolichyl-phosphate-mannose-protein mannosyltransferase [Lutibacter sp. Hel_I_33_5]|uniref:ArnT family glycosyltransferase n=1 Tax=Lutibacter sp. Hel_I_33_5 TaxID=1566289 RepID=UPI00119E3879|nr:glycosyltransferase family 39 protein [Lutibacter sp. Hel_I_33_5]TVZ57370.1 dolichyl-phosphate-mannose-protein mannosyltransferase [Lutibacter sp. Hel_I_33_5]